LKNIETSLGIKALWYLYIRHDILAPTCYLPYTPVHISTMKMNSMHNIL